MNRVVKEKVYSICGRELLFKPNLKFSFLIWYEQNMENSTSNDICTNLIESLNISQGDARVDILNNDERLEILNIIAREKGFSNTDIHNCDDFVSELKEYYHSLLKEAVIKTHPIAVNFFEPLSIALTRLSTITQNISKTIASSGVVDAIKALVIRLEEFPKEVETMHEKLLLQGWYLPLSILLELEPSYSSAIINLENEDINYEMMLFSQKIENDLLPEVEKSFTSRSTFIEEALKHHNENNYMTSIPLMLIQADGITMDILGIPLFDHQGKRKELMKNTYIEDNDIRDYLSLLPLIIDSAISANRNARKVKSYYRFNRHEILHGEDLNYGTRENSYRCIMLLKYLIDVNDYIRNQQLKLI